MNKVLITGGLGMIGSTIGEKLLSEGKEVVIVDNEHRENVSRNRARVQGAIIHKEDILHIDEKSPWKHTYGEDMKDVDAIIHCAANPGIPVSLENPEYDFKVNALGTLKMLELARKKDLAFIYCSTNKVYPQEFIDALNTKYADIKKWGGVELTNEIVGGTHSPYGCSKLVGDLYCSEYFNTYGVKTVINRMSCIYGTHQYGTEEQGWIAHFIFSAIQNKTINIFGDGKQVRDCLWAEDLAKLFMIELENIDKFGGSKWNVGGGIRNTLSLLECIETIEKLSGKKIGLKYHPPRIADHKVYVSDITPLEKWWKPTVNPTEGVKRLYDWAVEANK